MGLEPWKATCQAYNNFENCNWLVDNKPIHANLSTDLLLDKIKNSFVTALVQRTMGTVLFCRNFGWARSGSSAKQFPKLSTASQKKLEILLFYL